MAKLAPNGALGVRMWLIIMAACGLAAIPFFAAGFWLDANVISSLLEIPLAGILAGRLLMRYRETHRFGSIVEGSLLMSLAGIFGLMVCYAAAAGGAPLADMTFLELDRRLGYDWKDYAQLFSGNRPVRLIFQGAYISIFIQPIIIAPILYFTGQAARFEKFILATMFSVSITASIFFLFPATTAWTFLGQEELAARVLSDLPLSTNSWVTDLIRVRAGGGRHVTSAAGIVAFPSYHCISALLNIWAVWTAGRLRLGFVVLNLVMIASAPIFGGHYVIDLVGGALVAGLTIVVIGPFHRGLLNSKFLRLPNALDGWLSQCVPLRQSPAPK
jgi:hypothetical protein